MKCNNCGSEISGISRDLICPACGKTFVFENIDDLVASVISWKDCQLYRSMEFLFPLCAIMLHI